MPLGPEMVADFAVIMAIAAAVTYLFHRLKQPLILGYLIAGVIIGPYTPPFSLVNRLDVVEGDCRPGVHSSSFRRRARVSHQKAEDPRAACLRIHLNHRDCAHVLD